MNDDKLLQDAIKKVAEVSKKRVLDFCALLGISEQEYDFALQHKNSLKERPFLNSPLAQDAFVYGWINCRRNFVTVPESHAKEKSDG